MRLAFEVGLGAICIAIGSTLSTAGAQTAPFEYLDNVEGDFVNLNPVPIRPMVITPDNGHLYAVNTQASRILHFDNPSGVPTQVFHTPRSPVAVALWAEVSAPDDPDRLVVACRDTYALAILRRSDGATLAVLELRDPATNRILAEPSDLLVNQDTDTAFVSCAAADAVAEIDLTGPAVVRVFRLPGKHPTFMCFDENMDVLVAPLFSGNNSGPRGIPINTQHQGPTVVDFATTAIGPSLPDEDLFRLVLSTGAVQPVTTAGFMLQPAGFFSENPALDVPPARSTMSCCVE